MFIMLYGLSGMYTNYRGILIIGDDQPFQF